MNHLIYGLTNFKKFDGRDSRQQYWMFGLFVIAVYVAVAIVSRIIHLPILHTIYSLAIALPAIAAGIRRMHDIDKSGWFQCIPFYGLYLACLPGTPGDNKYGPPPAPTPTNPA